jgi:hypothetical protein
LLDGAVNLTEVVDARVLLRSRTRLQEVGNRDRGQETNNGHHNHDFHQRETSFAGHFYFYFHTAFLSALGSENAQQAGYYDFSLCSLIACRNQFVLNQAAPMPKTRSKQVVCFPTERCLYWDRWLTSSLLQSYNAAGSLGTLVGCCPTVWRFHDHFREPFVTVS